LRQRLARRGTPSPIVDETITRLRDLGLVNDETFARSWVENRDHTSPRSRRLLALELRNKGVARPIVQDSLATLDEDDAAYRAAARRARSLASLPYTDFRRRLSDLLLRRGFGYETARSTVARLWEEVAQHRPRTTDE
jgi:regulatory protein